MHLCRKNWPSEQTASQNCILSTLTFTLVEPLHTMKQPLDLLLFLKINLLIVEQDKNHLHEMLKITKKQNKENKGLWIPVQYVIVGGAGSNIY